MGQDLNSRIQVQKLHLDFLLVFPTKNIEIISNFQLAVDDLSTPTVFVGKVLSEKLRNLNRKVEVHYVSGGHLLDPPCFPHHEAVFSAFAGKLLFFLLARCRPLLQHLKFRFH